MVRIIALLLLSVPVSAAPVSAETVYKTVEEGVPTFSDTPPVQGAAEVLTLQVPEATEDGLLEERLAAMRETTQRMASDRRERETHRAEMRAMQIEGPVAERDEGPALAGPYPYAFWPSSAYPWRPRPAYPAGRLRPNPLPVANPPPGWSVMQPGNRQLMRPIVSSSP